MSLTRRRECASDRKGLFISNCVIYLSTTRLIYVIYYRHCINMHLNTCCGRDIECMRRSNHGKHLPVVQRAG